MPQRPRIIDLISLGVILTGLTIGMLYGLAESQAAFGSTDASISAIKGTDQNVQAHAREEYGKLPLSFVANDGQTDSRVKFISRGGGYSLFLTSTEAVLALSKPQAGKRGAATKGNTPSHQLMADQLCALSMKLIGVQADPRLEGLDELPGKVNYLVGNDAGKWRTNVPTYSKVKYQSIYPGVDLVYYGNQQQLEYDFIVSPGADPGVIKIAFQGIQKLGFGKQGNLVLRMKGGDVSLQKPYVYQEVNGQRLEITSRYVLQSQHQVGFQIGDYDKNRPLIIDPVLVYSTYLGGTNAVEDSNDYFIVPSHGNDEAHGIAVDSAGNVFVAGTTTATKDFPVTQGAYRTTFERNGATSSEDAFVTKLNAAGDGLIYSTRLGGIGSDQAFAIGIDNAGNAYVTGKTQSPDFPATLGALTPNPSDAFVIKLNPTGTALAYSAILGSGVGNAIAVDSSGNAYIGGQSFGPGFSVTPGAFQTVAPGGAAEGFLNGFITKINSAGDALLYSTFLGGRREEEIDDIAIDASGNAYVVGYTDFHDFPITPGAFMTFGNATNNGGLGGGPFVTKLNSTGSALVYSTYVRGDSARGLVVNPSGEVYVTGTAQANLTPTNDAFQQTYGGSADAFLTKLNASGSNLLYSTYLGGSDQDHGTCIAMDNAGSIYIAGTTYSTNFPLTQDTFQTTASGNHFDVGSFVAKIGEATTAQTYRIKGRLTDSNGNAIARARVKLVGSPGGTQFTDTNGNYSFGSLTQGSSYSVTPSSPYYDFNPQSRNFDNLSADQIADFSATVRRYSISGSVKDTNGKPLEGATLTLSGAQSATTQTDVNGAYAFSDLLAVGNYTITPSKTNYLFSPFRQTFSNLDGNQSANFTGLLVYSIKGQVLDPAGKAVPGIRINITSGIGSTAATTNSTGNYLIAGLPAGDNYTVTPENVDYTFSPTVQSFNNLSDHQTANFTATYRYGSIGGRITDADGKGMYYVLVTLSGAQNISIRTDGNGNYLFSRLLKGNNYTVSAFEFGYTLSPATTNLTITEDHTVNFTATLKKLKPFTSGNILVTSGIVFSGKYLAEYTPSGTLVQGVIVPFPIANNGNVSYYLGDLVLDKNGEVEIYNGPDAAAYLTSYSFSQEAWRHHTYPGWNPWVSYHMSDGIATFGNYIYVTDAMTNDFGQPTQTQGIIRININDYSSQRFAGDLTFCHLTLGQDGLLYGIVGGTAGEQVNAYNPETMQLVKTIHLTDSQNSPQNVHQIAVNRAGEIFATAFSVHHFDSSGKMVKSLQLPSNLTDIEISNNGQIAASTLSAVTLLDESLNITGSFTVPIGAGHVAFTNTITSPPTLQFNALSYSAGEGDGRANITMIRTGDTSSAATVNYATSDPAGLQNCNVINGIASSRCDYATSVGTLRFAIGETSKTISIPVVDDNFTEGNETFTLTLSNPVGASLGTVSSTTVTITDNASTAGNPIDVVPFFVRQNYIDFLGREPDAFGNDGWQAMLNNCAAGDITCDRIEVSSRFFRSAEFQERGYYVYRFYSASFGRKPNYEEFIPDVAKVSGFLTEAEKEANKVAFVDEFMQRAEFRNRYDVQVTPTDYVNALLTTAGLLNHPSKAGWIAGLGNGSLTRGQVLRQLAESQELSEKYKVEAFVVMQYFGYLRRNPDSFYRDWIAIMNQDPLNYRNMVNGFMNSTEYRNRFAP